MRKMLKAGTAIFPVLKKNGKSWNREYIETMKVMKSLSKIKN